MLQQIFNIKNVGLPKHIFQVHNKTRFIFCVMISCDLYIFLIFLNNILQNTFFGSFFLYFQNKLSYQDFFFFFCDKSKWILHMAVKNSLMPALSHVILGASKDSSLTYTSDGRQPKPHTVLSTTDRNLKLAPGY